MTDYAEPGSAPAGYAAVEREPPEVLGRNLISAGHLLASATAFFFLAFLFAYFYLRSLNNSGLWHPKGVSPSAGLGTAVMVLCVLSAVLVRAGVSDDRAGRSRAMLGKGLAGLVLGVVALVLQVVEWTQVGFGPADGGYASVFFGWTGFYALFLLFTMYWLETVVATAYRYRNTGGEPPPGHASGDPHRMAPDVGDALSVERSELEAVSFYWAFLAGIGVITWIVLYLL